MRRATNITRPEDLSREAHDHATEADQWLTENREAIAAWNQNVDQNGLPLAAYRTF